MNPMDVLSFFREDCFSWRGISGYLLASMFGLRFGNDWVYTNCRAPFRSPDPAGKNDAWSFAAWGMDVIGCKEEGHG